MAVTWKADLDEQPVLDAQEERRELEPMSIEREDESLLQNGAEPSPEVAPPAWRAARRRTMFVVNVASVLERTDEQMLPSVYKYVSCSLHARPDQLGLITSSRAVCQALASGLGGYLGHVHNRVYVIALGCMIWGTTTMLFSFTSSVGLGAFTWAWNGVGLSFVIPNTQSLVADYYSENSRGAAFGTLYTTGALGGMLGAAYATNIAGIDVFGTAGWRFAFRTVAAVAMLIGYLTLRVARDPDYMKPDGSAKTKDFVQAGGLRTALSEFAQVAKVPTFQVIIVQGILGSTPWNALVFLTVYLQLLGFSNANASLVLSLFLGGAALGGILGGVIGDWAAKHYHNHGRILVCQFSVFMGIPFSLVLMKLLPKDGEPVTVALYCAWMFLFGLMHVWAAPACNNPIFAEIVPAHLRNLVYAFDRSFEGAIAALGAPLVGIVAERLYGFPTDSPTYQCEEGRPIDALGSREGKAASLGNAMLLCMVVPWALCLVTYSALHWTYPRDRWVVLERLPMSVQATASAVSSSPRG